MDLKQEAARVAYTLIKNDSSIGLGDGATIRWLAGHLAEGIRSGLNICLYTSSLQTKDFLQQAGIPVPDISSTDSLDQYFDGCDQLDSQLNALKSGAGIHTQEKLLGAMAKQFIILGDDSKFVKKLENKFPLVLEVLPQATKYVIKKIKTIFPEVSLSIRTQENTGRPLITRNGNHLLDCRFPQWPELAIMQNQCKNITGVVEISLFYNLVTGAIIAGHNGVRRYERIHEQVSIIQNPF